MSDTPNPTNSPGSSAGNPCPQGPAGENLVLVGMRASGKTTLGRELARRTGAPFVDLDEELGRRAGRDADELLRTEGEAAFRALERDLLRWAAALRGHVVATGGGAVLGAEAFSSLCASATVVYLEWSPEALIDRGTRRPRAPLRAGSLADEVRSLLSERAALYEAAADLTISGGDGDPILEILSRWPRQTPPGPARDA